MKQFIVVALVTALGAVAGFFVGKYVEGHAPLPAPPVPWGAEFRHPAPPNWRRTHPINRAELVTRIRDLQPQLAAFQARLHAIDEQFNRSFDALLSPEQKRTHADRMATGQRRRRDLRGENSSAPLTDNQISFMLHEEAEHTILWDVVIPLRLDVLTKEYNLSDAQREQVRHLLEVRRAQFLDLVDSSPPPSVWLSRLSGMVQRLSPPPK